VSQRKQRQEKLTKGTRKSVLEEEKKALDIQQKLQSAMKEVVKAGESEGGEERTTRRVRGREESTGDPAEAAVHREGGRQSRFLPWATTVIVMCFAAL
jgi:hypothetical protein